MLASSAFKDPKFMAANFDAASKLGVNDFDMLASLALESGLDPKVANRSGTNNHGLFQIGPGALADMRKRDPSIKARTPAEFAAMYSASQQAKFYGDYLKMKGVKPGASFDDIRMATLFPAAIGKKNSYVLFGKNAAIASYRPGSGGIGADSYKNHASMDGAIDGVRDGSITKGEAATFYRKSAASYFNRTPPVQFTPSGSTAQQNVNVTVTVMGEIKGAKNVVIATRQTNASQPRGRG